MTGCVLLEAGYALQIMGYKLRVRRKLQKSINTAKFLTKNVMGVRAAFQPRSSNRNTAYRGWKAAPTNLKAIILFSFSISIRNPQSPI